MSTKTASKTAPEIDVQVSASLALTRRFMLAQMANTELIDEIPNGATMVLIPDDDPAQAEREITLGLAAVRAGKNAYFRHIRMSDLPQ